MNYVSSAPAGADGCQDEILLNDWHVIAYSHEVPSGKLLPITLLERDLVAWRDDGGDVHVWEDLCVHRGARLSEGSIRNNTVVCPYHGWRYDSTASCVLMPARRRKSR